MIKSSLTKISVPYRGPTNTEDYMNFIGEVVHDIRYLMFFMDRHDNVSIGHTDYISNNLRFIWDGGSSLAYSNIPTTRILYKSGILQEFVSTKQTKELVSVQPSQSIRDRLSIIEDNLYCANSNTR